ncbi:AAA family ATPase [Bacteroides sp.]|uniref:AAA family ATPase n=1 Tax=Bacteroides sp. TaxID=29523 RepID=UPI0026323F24|nr:AAA family ATPase [Bacteroides sp.]MDD3037592.1 AAA family ATPase [Bacteroides sp.]
MEIRERIQLLLVEMNRGVYEKEREISLSLLAALAGESILLLGPPGVAKSMVARRLKKAFVKARAFEYLMSRFSTPDEIFGPVSISRLKVSDKYERVVDGYLPMADVVFLDEIWKAGPAIQNTLLTVINEKLFRNGDTELKLPLKLLVAASNELPTQGEGLEALWDRFLLRVICTCVKQEDTFYMMLLNDSDEVEETTCQWQISNEEYAEWQKKIRQITVAADVLSCITEIRKYLSKVEIQTSEVHRSVYISDRRWKNIVRLLKTSAFIHGRIDVSTTDILPIYHCLWNEPDEYTNIRQIVIRAVFVPYVKELTSVTLSLKSDLKVSRVREALEKARQKGDRRDDDLLITDHFYYQVENHGTGNTYIFIVDYKNMKEYSTKDAPMVGVMYTDPLNPKRTIIRTFSDAVLLKEQGAERVTLFRDSRHLYINGVRFPMKRLTGGEQQQLWLGNLSITDRDYETELEVISAKIDKQVKGLRENIFVTEEDKKEIDQYIATIRKEIAWARVDVRKLRYGDE